MSLRNLMMGTLNVALPTEKTELLDVSESFSDKNTYTINVPRGVKVIEVYFCIKGIPFGTYDGALTGNKQWVYLSTNGSSASKTVYVGVTGTKQYNLSLSNSKYALNYEVAIYYSTSINQQTPTVTDY